MPRTHSSRGVRGFLTAARRLGVRRIYYFDCAILGSKLTSNSRDAILGITEAFKKDSFPQKINLGVGAYRTLSSGKPKDENT